MTYYIIGHLAIDQVIIDGKSYPISLGGTATFSSIVGSRLISPETVFIISKIGPDFPDDFISLLNQFNVDIKYVYKVKRHSTRYILDYIKDNRKLILKSICDSITEDDFPDEISKAKLIYFGPIANEIPAETIINIKQTTNSLVALDIQGLIRHRDTNGKLYFKTNKKLDEVLSYIDVLKLDIFEAQTVTGASRMRDITAYLTNLGLKFFIITKSRKGSVLFYEGKLIKIPAIILKHIYNITGAGDCFFSSFLIEYIKSNDPIQAIQFATKVVSYFIGSAEGIQVFSVKGDIYTLVENFLKQNQIK